MHSHIKVRLVGSRTSGGLIYFLLLYSCRQGHNNVHILGQRDMTTAPAVENIPSKASALEGIPSKSGGQHNTYPVFTHSPAAVSARLTAEERDAAPELRRLLPGMDMIPWRSLKILQENASIADLVGKWFPVSQPFNLCST